MTTRKRPDWPSDDPGPGKRSKPNNQTAAKMLFGFFGLIIFGMLGLMISMAPLLIIGIPAFIGLSYVTGAILFQLFPKVFGDLL